MERRVKKGFVCRQLLDKDGITDDIHLFNDKLREWEDYYNYHRPHGALWRSRIRGIPSTQEASNVAYRLSRLSSEMVEDALTCLRLGSHFRQPDGRLGRFHLAEERPSTSKSALMWRSDPRGHAR